MAKNNKDIALLTIKIKQNNRLTAVYTSKILADVFQSSARTFYRHVK